jgi:hypothetical protein
VGDFAAGGPGFGLGAGLALAGGSMTAGCGRDGIEGSGASELVVGVTSALAGVSLGETPRLSSREFHLADFSGADMLEGGWREIDREAWLVWFRSAEPLFYAGNHTACAGTRKVMSLTANGPHSTISGPAVE